MASAHVGTPATVALTRAAIDFTVHAYEHDPAAPSYGREAATALGVDPGAVFKTLLAEADGALVVAVVPVSGQLDLKALARVLGAKKAAMADPAAAERSSGYVVGGISPIGQRRQLPTVIDETAELFDVVYVSAGKRGVELGLAPADLARVLDATLGPIGRG